MPASHLYVFGEMSVKVFCLFFDWVVWGFFVVIELFELFMYFGD